MKPLTDAELQQRIRQYNADAINMVVSAFTRHTMQPRALGEADDEHSENCERRAMEIMDKAAAAFRSAIQDAQALTDLRKKDLGYLLDALDDYLPSRDRWEEDVQRGVA